MKFFKYLLTLSMIFIISPCNAYAITKDNVGGMNTDPVFDEDNNVNTLGAGVAQILEGFSAWVSGSPVIGTMSDYTDTDITITDSVTEDDVDNINIKVPSGYYATTTNINVPLALLKQNITSYNSSIATATASDILAGKTAWVNGVKITGAMQNFDNTTKSATSVIDKGDKVFIVIPATGYYSTASKLEVPIATLKSNIGAFQNNAGYILYSIEARYSDEEWNP